MHIDNKHKVSVLQAYTHFHHELNSIDALVLAPPDQNLLCKSMQGNCYFSHFESLLLVMLRNDDTTVRAKAIKLIRKI